MKKLMFVVMLFLVGCYPALKRPQELAKWSNCDPGYIADYIGSMTAYKVQPGFEPAETVMRRQESDCKGRAQIALETLQACGVKAHIVQLSNPNKPADHVVTVFTLPNGKRGFINAGQYGVYPKSVSWRDIIKEVDDGNWRANFAEE